MTDQNHQLATRQTFALTSFEDMDRVSKEIADSGMFGVKTKAQAFTLMMLCTSEGLNPIDALRRYHIVEGKPSRRADSIASDFEAQGGAIIWHARTDELVGATFFADKTRIDDNARTRAKARFKTLWEFTYAKDDNDRARLMEALADLSNDGEDTIIRTLEDAMNKKLAMAWDKEKGEWKLKHNWMQSPRQMLTARVVSEGVRLIKPSVIAGMGTEDEVRDALDSQHQQLLQDAGQQPGGTAPGDIEAMRSIMESHIANANEAKTQSEKQRLLGLASEMRCMIAEAEEAARPKEETRTLPAPTEARTVETEVMPPEGKQETPAAPATPTPEKKAEVPHEDWMDVVCNYGTTTTNKFFGKTMKEMFVTSTLETATKIADILMKKSKFIAGVAAKVQENIELDPIEETNYFAILKGKQHVVARTVAAAKEGSAS